MQLKIEKAPLLDVLQGLVTIVPTKSTMQVLTNFLISLKGTNNFYPIINRGHYYVLPKNETICHWENFHEKHL